MHAAALFWRSPIDVLCSSYQALRNTKVPSSCRVKYTANAATRRMPKSRLYMFAGLQWVVDHCFTSYVSEVRGAVQVQDACMSL